MATLDTRPYSKNYSGLETQTTLALVIGSLCLTSFELMRRKRRMTKEHREALRSGIPEEGLGSVESWEFGYLYQGRCWAKRPSPPLPRLPLAWVKQMINFKEADFLPLVGPDTTVYARFLRGIWYFMLLHTFTTLPILLPIHLVYAPADVSPKSMTRASLSSLVSSSSGKHLLVVHLVIIAYIACTWVAVLLWICRGAFRYRRQAIKLAAEKVQADEEVAKDHPIPGVDEETRRQLRGWRLRTVMLTNIPAHLRDEKLIRQYFDYYLALVKSEPPPVPGLIQRWVAFLHRNAQARAARDVERSEKVDEESGETASTAEEVQEKESAAIIDKVVIVRKMTELASLVQRRDEVLKKLEEAHIKLAQKTLGAVKEWMEKRRIGGKTTHKFLKRMSQKEAAARAASVKCKEQRSSGEGQDESEEVIPQEASNEEEERLMNSLVEVLSPYLEDFGMTPKPPATESKTKISSPWLYRRLRGGDGGGHSREPSAGEDETPTTYPPNPDHPVADKPTIWEVLHNIPRHDLDAFQPLIRLNSLFRGATVPAIDYYTTKLGLLTALINESRSKPTSGFLPASTAFVTFANPQDALKAIRLLPSHPKNPIACLVTPAPEFSDLDWSRLMTKTYTGEFLKDWVVDIGVWGFTCLWIIPVSGLVSLVSINSLSTIWPGLSDYLSRHPLKQEIISSLLPTLLVTGLAILVPLILLLIAKKAHNIVLLSKLHDQIMTRYHKFLVCNVLIFFCVGVSALQTFITSWKHPVSPLPVLASRFPDAAPFYVGWLIFQTAMHAGLELGLLGLPLIVYPATVWKATTPRQRKAGTRPRTFNFYYWLPNHLIVLFIFFCFSILNPLVIPFAFIYYSVAFVVFRHQFLHVYSKAYELNATVLLIRIVRYSMDGVILSQFIFLALFIILHEDVLAGLSGLFFAISILVKLYLTWYIRANYAIDAITEAKLICADAPTVSRIESQAPEEPVQEPMSPSDTVNTVGDEQPLQGYENDEHHGMSARLHGFLHHRPHFHRRHRTDHGSGEHNSSVRFWTWKLPSGAVQFAYSTLPARQPRQTHAPNPFRQDAAASSQDPISAQPDSSIAQRSVPQLALNPGVIQLSAPAPMTYTDPFAPAMARNASTIDQYTTRRRDLVQPHERRQPWDDAPRYDLTYDNPHYTRPIDNVLWLPLNPCAILDLDQTVLVHRAITSEPGAGALGQWVNESSSVAPTPVDTGRTDGEVVEDGEELSELPLVGTEKIEIRRTLSIRGEEEDVEAADEGSTAGVRLVPKPPTRRKSSFTSNASTSAGPSGGRSFSGGTTSSVQGYQGRTLRPMSSRTSARSLHISPPPLITPATPRAQTLGLGLPSAPPVTPTPRNPGRVLSLNSKRSRARAGSVAASQYSATPFDAASHVDLGSQSPFADPNFNIILRTPSRFIDDSPEELPVPPELGGMPPVTSPVRFTTPRDQHNHRPQTQESGRSGPERKSSFLSAPTSTGGQTFHGRPRSNSRFSVSTREAVVGEVLAEEQIAATERVKRETEESAQQGAPRSFLTAWLYNTLANNDNDTTPPPPPSSSNE